MKLSKVLITFVVITAIAVLTAVFVFMFKSAEIARDKSDKILKEFKTIEKDLQKTNDVNDSLGMTIDSLVKANKQQGVSKGVGAIQ